MKVVVIGVCIVISIYLLVLMINIIKKPTSNFVVEEGKIYKEEPAEGYIIREENPIDIPNSSNGIVAIRSEGEKVAKGESIYRYCIENEEEINNNISNIDKQIQELIGNDEEEEYYSADIKIINTQIASKLDI